MRIHAGALKWHASIACAILVLVLLGDAACSARADDEHPLRPIATDGPRETLLGFMGTANQISLLFEGLLKTYAGSKRLYLNADEHAIQLKVADLAPDVIGVLDTSRISPVLRDTVPTERALMLKAILDRIELPEPGAIPDRAEMTRLGLKKWRLPDTAIDFVLIESGPDAGKYLISADTVDKLPEFYQRVKALPPREATAQALVEELKAITHGNATTLYDFYRRSPAALGFIVPPRWLLTAPSWVISPELGLAVWQWFGLGLGLAISTLLVFMTVRIATRIGTRRWAVLPLPLMIVFVTGVFLPIVLFLFHISGNVRVVMSYAATGVLYLALAWLCMTVAVVVSAIIVSSEQLQARSLDSQLIRLGTRFCGLVGACLVLVNGADQLGLPAYSVIAGLGVGGLAIALAARDSVANLLGSVLIMFEKPFRVGHLVRVAETVGTVEDVGFRSTRLRTLDNSLVSIPNDSVVNSRVENLTLRPARRQRFLVQVTYDTTPPQLEALLAALRDLLTAHEFVDNCNFHVRFNDFGESSLNILVIFHILTTDFGLELQYREEILIKIMRLVTDMGLSFAFPTRTLLVEAFPSEADQRHARLRGAAD